MKKLAIFIALVLLTSCAVSVIQQKISQTMNPTVRVTGSGSCGSGTIVACYEGDDGLFTGIILTNHHVINGALNYQGVVDVETWTYDMLGFRKEDQKLTAKIIHHNQSLDYALLKVTSTKKLATAYLLPDYYDLELFDEVWFVGCQLCEEPSMTRGEIVDLYTKLSYEELFVIKTNAPVIYGNSGGGCYVKKDGLYYLIGIPSRIGVCRDGFVPHMSYVVPLKDVLKDIRTNTERIFSLAQ